MATKHERVPDLPFQQILDEVLIVAPHERNVHRLNDVAARIWTELERPRTLEQLVSAVTKEFDVDPKTAKKDVRLFLKELKGKGLVRAV
ncbi:MAG: PqqD family protein [Planctomycetota bacterium]|jgi:hypothetical protein